MRKVTFSAPADLIENARRVARSQGTTLNTAFRQWLLQFTARANATAADALMKRLRHVRAGRRFSRVEMTDR